MKRTLFALYLALTLPTHASNNILLIIADDFGTDASVVFNSSPTAQLAPTPNIASLAANGIKFTNAYSYTVCSPARSAMLTGRYGSRTGTANVVGGATSNNALKAAEFTLPEAFAANGGLDYQLKHIGKWHLGGANTAPCLIGGWPAYAGATGPEVADFYNWTKVTGNGATAAASTVTTYATTDNVNDALAFISTQTAAGRPWFTWVAFNAPHDPYHKPPDALHSYDTTVANWASLPVTGNELMHYNAAIEALDTEIGRLLAGVNLSTTTVIFVGDNGTPPTTLQSPFPANRGKSSLYEGGIRVPLIIRGPDVVSPGRTSTVLTHVVDLYSTVLELAGINVGSTVPGGTAVDSQSLLPVLQNQSVTRPRVFDDYWDFAFPNLSDSGRVLRDTQYKLTRLKNGPERFYDLNADPYESTNLIAGGFGSMTAPRQAAYNSLATQLVDFNTPPTVSTVANRSTPQGVATGPIAFTIGDAELSTDIVSVAAASSNTTLVPTANIVLGGAGANRTVNVTPAAGQNGSATITLSANDGTFITTSSFVLTVGAPTTINSVSRNPATPTNTDAVTVTANITPGSGTTLSSVQLSYNTGTQVAGTVFREVFSNGSTASGLAGAINGWTATANRAATDVKQRGSTGNRTVPVVLTNCSTNGTTSVTCASTNGLWPGMNLSGSGIAAGTTISQVTSATAFTTNIGTGTGTGLSLTAAGVSLTGCSLGTSPTINTASTTGLAIGMGIAGGGLTTNPPNPLVNAITNGTSFTVNSTVTAVPATLTASGCGLEFAVGNATYTDTMATITNPINASGASAGGIDFYVRNADMVSNNGWAFQVSPAGGANWTTRLSESYANATATNCSLNATATVTCSDTSKLTVGNIVQGAALPLSCTTNATTTVTCTNTTGLLVGMFVSGNGIPNNSRVTAITPNTNFTLNNAATNSAAITVLANYFNANITITAINPNVSFTLSTANFVSASGVTLASINHGFQSKHYDFGAGELTSTLKFRFQWSGSTATQPARNPTCDIDDISLTLTTGAAPQSVTMFDDGLHGDGAAGDGVYGATIPLQSAGANVSYTITATDSLGGTTTASGSYTVGTAAPVLAVTPATTLSAAGAAGSGTFTPSSITYTLTNNGTGTMSWIAGKTQSWLSLSSTSGSLAAGANTTVAASINAAANTLAVGGYSDTITFNNSTSGAGNTTRAVNLTVNSSTPPAMPVLAALPAYSQGASKTIAWSAVTGATSYTLQISATADFRTVLASQTVTNPTGSFANLANGVTYYYRALAMNNIGSSLYSNIVSSTQDTGAPLVAITSPASGTSTATNTITVTGTSSDAISGISKMTVNGVTASTVNGFANWNITVPLGFGTNGITAVAYDGAGNVKTTAPVLVTLTAAQTYNPLIIPEVMTGTTFDLNLHTATKQFLPGVATNTYAYNNMLFWGPTLIMDKGDWVQMNVTNNLADTTTTHWHGFHIPAIMDGGPHQTIPAGTTWRPSFKVDNNPGLYWYHPHLHEFTQQQLTRGGGGLIIIRDPEEAALSLPRTYGVDDIPLALTSRRFLTAGGNTNQFATANSAYGDYMVVNGTMNPQVTLPRQYVRLRILNAEIERSYNLGFSDGRTFYQIATDGGLVNAPIPLTRLVLAVGERAEILVDLTGATEGSTLDLQAFNSGQTVDFPGSEPTTVGQFGSQLNNTTFSILRINVGPATANPVTTRPTTLKTNAFWTGTDVTNDRALQITGGFNGATDWGFDNLPFSPSVINQTLNLDAVERWTITNNSAFSHSFHIHDIQFHMTGRTGGSNTGLKAFEAGWKDTLFIGRLQTVTFIAKFDGFASNTNPFMYHCHFSNHEDEGLMGQFLVVNNAIEDLAIASFTRTGDNSLIQLDFKATPGTTYTLQYSPNMTTGSWTDIGSVTSDGSSATFIETDPTRLGQARGFYRVTIPTIP